MKKNVFISLFFFSMSTGGFAQFTHGTTGLLNMPTADMQRDKTFMLGSGFLEHHVTPTRWFYNTYNYYLNITFLPWLEVSYDMTLFKSMENDRYAQGYWVPSTYGKFVNQDRHFSVRLRALKEGQLWKYMPAIVVGCNDLTTSNAGADDGSGYKTVESTGNGFWNRYYIAATKHINFYGELGLHLAYVYNNRDDYPLNGPCIGVNYHPAFHRPLNFMAEYDSKSINIGLGYSLWKEHINFIGELNRCKYPSVGIYFKVFQK